jgi:hypothetical protein
MYLEDQTTPKEGNTKRTEILPAQHNKRTLEEQMISYLEMLLITHDRRTTIHQKILSMEKGPGVEAIMNKWPKENLVPLLTTTIPHPFNCRNSTNIHHQSFINMRNFNAIDKFSRQTNHRGNH